MGQNVFVFQASFSALFSIAIDTLLIKDFVILYNAPDKLIYNMIYNAHLNFFKFESKQEVVN